MVLAKAAGYCRGRVSTEFGRQRAGIAGRQLMPTFHAGQQPATTDFTQAVGYTRGILGVLPASCTCIVTFIADGHKKSWQLCLRLLLLATSYMTWRRIFQQCGAISAEKRWSRGSSDDASCCFSAWLMMMHALALHYSCSSGCDIYRVGCARGSMPTRVGRLSGTSAEFLGYGKLVSGGLGLWKVWCGHWFSLNLAFSLVVCSDGSSADFTLWPMVETLRVQRSLHSIRSCGAQ